MAETRLTVLGGGGAGKSCLTIRYTMGHFADGYDPTVEDTYRKGGMVDNKACMVLILDTAGQEQYRMMRDSWMRGSDAFLLVFDVGSRTSYDELDDFVSGITRVKDVDSCEQLPVIIVGNKCDLTGDRRRVSREEAEHKAYSIGCKYCETSAMAAIGVDEAFELAVREHRPVEHESGRGEMSGRQDKCLAT
mmetsp:Transcript_735/g.1990  ORF Transcript_735/g.1990 Transcript_735/m.1990 type:complete len:191 (+) Transcript_735:127-699(+)